MFFSSYVQTYLLCLFRKFCHSYSSYDYDSSFLQNPRIVLLARGYILLFIWDISTILFLIFYTMNYKLYSTSFQPNQNISIASHIKRIFRLLNSNYIYCYISLVFFPYHPSHFSLVLERSHSHTTS